MVPVPRLSLGVQWLGEYPPQGLWADLHLALHSPLGRDGPDRRPDSFGPTPESHPPRTDPTRDRHRGSHSTAEVVVVDRSGRGSGSCSTLTTSSKDSYGSGATRNTHTPRPVYIPRTTGPELRLRTSEGPGRNHGGTRSLTFRQDDETRTGATRVRGSDAPQGEGGVVPETRRGPPTPQPASQPPRPRTRKGEGRRPGLITVVPDGALAGEVEVGVQSVPVDGRRRPGTKDLG